MRLIWGMVLSSMQTFKMKLLFENWKKYLTENIKYTAFVLDDESSRSLASRVPEGWKKHSHHMTLIPPTSRSRLPRGQFFEGCLTVTGIASNERVITARVDVGDEALLFKIKGLPHVTIATNPSEGGRPEMSNEFVEEDFKPIDPIKICGKVMEIV